MKIVLVNRYFFPDYSATSQLLSDLAFHLAALGREVHVITSRQRYDEPGARLPPHEVVHGVTVHRVWTSKFGRRRLAGRVLDYLTFLLFTGLTLLRVAARGDVVVAKTDPPLLSLVTSPVTRVIGANSVNWLQDFFPEVAGAVGMDWADGWMGRLLTWLRDRTLRSAHLNVIPGTGMRQYLNSRGIGGDRLRVIHNWADGELIRPIRPEDNRLRREWGLDGKFAVGYSGNMGRVHEFKTILGGAEALMDDDGIVFLFIGDGAQREWLEREAGRRALSNVRFLPYQPTEQLALSLSAPNVHLISLRPELENFVVPSKFYGIAAAGRAAIFVGSIDGEIARIIDECHCGIIVRAGDIQGLRVAILKLKNDAELCKRYGRNARDVLDKRFNRHIALEAWTKALGKVQASSNHGVQ